MAEAKCEGGVCTCTKDTHYAKDGVCNIRVSPGQYCDAFGQCVKSAECSRGICECDLGFFARFDQCKQQVKAAAFCEGFPDECVVNAECMAGSCECDGGFFAKNGICR